MKFSNIPFVLVFLSCLTPMVGSFFNFSMYYHMPAGLLLIAMTIAYSSARNYFTLYNVCVTWATIILFAILIPQILTGRGFGILSSGGYVLIFACVFCSLLLTGVGPSIAGMIRGISLIYKFFIVGMIIEFIVIAIGMQPLLKDLFPSSVVPGYKDYNGADVLRFFGFFNDVGGLNSVLLGSQISGMLSLFSTIWFIGIMKSGIKKPMKDRSAVWLTLSLLMLMVTINGTVFVLLIFALFTVYIKIYKKNRGIVLCVISASIVALYYLISAGYLFPLMSSKDLIGLRPHMSFTSDFGLQDIVANMTIFDYYVFTFMSPVIHFYSASWIDKLIGLGAKFILTTSEYFAGDFGFGYSLMASGLLWMVVLVFTVFTTCFPAIRPVTCGSDDQKSWSFFGSVHGLIAILWLLSTMHYCPAFANGGGMTLFALHLALTIYCRKRQKTHILILPPLQIPK